VKQNFVGRHIELKHRSNGQRVYIERKFHGSVGVNNHILPAQKGLAIGHVAKACTPREHNGYAQAQPYYFEGLTPTHYLAAQFCS
jgi:hypothetical protein